MVAKKSAAPKADEPAAQRTAGKRSAGAAGRTAPKTTAKPAAKPAGAQQNVQQTAGEVPGRATTTGAKKVAAKKSTTAQPDAASAVPAARPAAPGDLAVRAGEEPWTAEEVTEARDELTREAEQLREEISATEAALSGLMRDSGDGAGDDQADTGSKNATREHEMALAGNAREMLYQTERALRRLEAGTYGLCESCGNAIGKARMQAFPRATLCVDCKQRQERRF
ncbi:TraR/DksA family transcriptional regulator [Streptomyces aidingensis]|uniref:DnaK suppressor protein n=1 Tax=Streptomyces aidingensis TaxID=910347 RepID=A0A1I1LTX8_9ACTN|nr:TraR/DksA family transcriptional regulator [Streptomyces aidingensis]SFC73753.1 DnaK suppressor protein [Streptomyces aidingensis]